MIELHDFVGLGGVVLGIYCYARLQWHRDFAKTLVYSLLNLASSVLIMISIAHTFNLTAFINNAIWGLISIYGVYRCLKYSRRVKKALSTSPIN